MNKKSIITALLFVAVLLVGLVGGNLLARRNLNFTMRTGFMGMGGNNKLSEVLGLIDQGYVDTLKLDSITDDAIIELLAKLDPHSAYIPARDLEIVNSDLQSSFSGIGVQFNIQKDTVNIVDVISGGPSESIGLLAGDKIVTVDDSVFVGKKINNEFVMHHLRGKKGTKVKLGILRQGTKEVLYYTITRGGIPVHSVDACYMYDQETGFIRVSKFAEKTYSEFVTALADLQHKGAKRYVIDLRENSGGIMEQAIRMANEFLPAGRMIVYSQGRAVDRFEAKSNGAGHFQNVPLVVLVDEYSASAAEIFAGAMQDNDRATIVGRRTFGKGLVQQQFPLSDGSAIRLTVARYYMPSGRCIQKPYVNGEDENYMMDIYQRFEHGEFDSRDSIHIKDSTVYKTVGGRIVYGGGGIIPDKFIGRDTSYYSPYYNKVFNMAYPYQFAFEYSNQNRTSLKQFKTYQDLEKYLKQQQILNQFEQYALKRGENPNPADLMRSGAEIQRMLIAYIARNIQGDKSFYPLLMRDDKMVKAAVLMLKK